MRMHTDPTLVAALRKGTVNENASLKMIYKSHYPTVLQYILSNNGDRDSAKDIFQEGMIILYRNVKSGKFKGDSSIGTYLYSICRFLWLKTLKKRGAKTDGMETKEVHFDSPLIALLDREKKELVLSVFQRLGEVCKHILLLSFYEELDMKEIAERTGFKDEQNVRNKKYKCMKSLKTLIKEAPEIEKDMRGLLN